MIGMHQIHCCACGEVPPENEHIRASDGSDWCGACVDAAEPAQGA